MSLNCRAQPVIPSGRVSGHILAAGAPKGQRIPRNLSGTKDRTGQATLEPRGDSRGAEDRGGSLTADSPVLSIHDTFAARHIGPSAEEQRAMLAALGYASLDEMTAAALPAGTEPPA